MRSIFSLIVLLFPVSIFANNKVGNGGNVVKCKGLPTQLLDFYEHEVKFSKQAGEYSEILEANLVKLEKAAPALAKQYRKRAESIKTEIEFTQNKEILEVPDSKHLFKPKNSNCSVIQVAVRNNLALKDDKKFIVRDDLWKELDSSQKAGLVLHEILNEHFAKLGEEHSIKARRVNAFIFGKSFDANQFWSLIQDLKLPLYP